MSASVQVPADGLGDRGAVRERVEPTPVAGVTLHHFDHIKDARGSLSVGEFERDVPFLPRRYFVVYDVPAEEIRGQHAHKECHQFLLCVRGACIVVADDGVTSQEFLLDSPTVGLYLPPMTWGVQHTYSADALLLVFASHHYDAADYVRDYAEFADLKRQAGVPSPRQALTDAEGLPDGVGVRGV
jgi:dTDP-4-dehydrorhamnose 3,5-epimerase-like enzyme